MTTPSKRHQALPATAHHQRVARLYQAVIMRALQDLSQTEHRDEAREWLLSSDSDFAFTTSGISPQSVRLQMI